MIYFIMPVGSDASFSSKRAALNHLLEQFRMEGHFPLESRAHMSFRSAQAVADMREASLIIADLALERPSCYYEVGLAHGAGLAVACIAPAGTAIHQLDRRHQLTYYEGEEDYVRVVSELISGVRG
jgi:hypothetical protein